MLFSYKFFTFSQLPNKFYIRKSITTHTTTTTTKKIRDQREKDWEIEGKRDRLGKRDRSLAVATIFSGGGEIGLGWWQREQDARLRSRWRRRWGRREKKEEAWPARDLGGGAAQSGLARAWLRWGVIWVLDRVRSVLELSLFKCGFRKLFEGKIKV